MFIECFTRAKFLFVFILFAGSVDGVGGRYQNGTGNFLVSGRCSTWDNAGELRVGDVYGQGSLNIESGGVVSNRASYVGS
ncbi:hypothetical protein KSU18_22500, partial [Enterobacter quasiroggenkampii]|nr:hypothetical protein [Enterobacter quasiroggenkampii]